MKTFLFAAATFLTLGLTGCDTFEHRTQEKAATFAMLGPEEKEKLRRGEIDIGNTPDMVYIALGRPDEKYDTTTAQGKETVWVYNSYHQEYEGNVHTGYHRIVLFDPVRKRYAVYFEPVYADVYSEHQEEHIRVTFVNDKVTTIEQPKRR